MTEELTLLELINEIPHLEGKFDMLDTIICLTSHPEVVDLCNAIMQELLNAPVERLEEVV